MKILFLTQTYPRFENDVAGPFIRDLARALSSAGDRVTVLAPRGEATASRLVDDAGVEVRTFPYAPRRFERFGYGQSLERDERPRPGALMVAPLYAAALRRAVRGALRSDPPDVVQAHWLVPNAVVLPRLDRPLVVGLHGSDVFLAERAPMRPLVRRALGRSAALTGCSPELVDRVCRLGFPVERSRVIPYGVDVERFAPGREKGAPWRQRLGVPAAAPLLLTVGRMVSKKGFGVLLAALPGILRQAPDAHVVLVGGGDLLPELRRGTAEFARRVHFPGVVLRDELPDLFRAADLFVLPAMHDRRGNVDGLPNVILEAMATALPVVASGISGIPLAVRDGIEGRLVPEQDPAALVAALVPLLGDGDERRRLGDAARIRVERELTWAAVAARYREAYEMALGIGMLAPAGASWPRGSESS